MFRRQYHSCCYPPRGLDPGDLVCTPAATEHDIVSAYTDDLVLLFFEEAVPPGGQPGHRHRDPASVWHPVRRA